MTCNILKTCRRCNDTKPIEEFSKSTLYEGGRHSTCKKCINKRTVENGSNRRYNYKKKYGVTVEWYDNTLKAQKGKCAICGTEEVGFDRKHFCIDHCHKTGEVRGLLCIQCNLSLGYVKDDEKVLEKMISYLKKHRRIAG